MKSFNKYASYYYFIALFLNISHLNATNDSPTSAIIDGQSREQKKHDWGSNKGRWDQNYHRWDTTYHDWNSNPSSNNDYYRFEKDRQMRDKGYIGSFYFYPINMPYNLYDSYPIYGNYPTTAESYASGFNNWVYPSYPYNGKLYKDQNYYRPSSR